MSNKLKSKIYLTKVSRDDGYIYARTMQGSLAEHIVIDLKLFELEELKYILEGIILPEIDEKLKVYKGGNHIRVFKDLEKSGSEGLLYIGDSPIIIDDVPLQVK